MQNQTPLLNMNVAHYSIMEQTQRNLRRTFSLDYLITDAAMLTMADTAANTLALINFAQSLAQAGVRECVQVLLSAYQCYQNTIFDMHTEKTYGIAHSFSQLIDPSQQQAFGSLEIWDGLAVYLQHYIQNEDALDSLKYNYARWEDMDNQTIKMLMKRVSESSHNLSTWLQRSRCGVS